MGSETTITSFVIPIMIVISRPFAIGRAFAAAHRSPEPSDGSRSAFLLFAQAMSLRIGPQWYADTLMLLDWPCRHEWFGVASRLRAGPAPDVQSSVSDNVASTAQRLNIVASATSSLSCLALLHWVSALHDAGQIPSSPIPSLL